MMRFLRRLANWMLGISLIAVVAVLAMSSDRVDPQRAAEAVLKVNLRTMRQAIDQFHEDHRRYPTHLDELVADRYLRKLPIDPMTDSSQTWIAIRDKSSADAAIVDVRSGAAGSGRDGELFSSW